MTANFDGKDEIILEGLGGPLCSFILAPIASVVVTALMTYGGRNWGGPPGVIVGLLLSGILVGFSIGEIAQMEIAPGSVYDEWVERIPSIITALFWLGGAYYAGHAFAVRINTVGQGNTGFFAWAIGWFGHQGIILAVGGAVGAIVGVFVGVFTEVFFISQHRNR